METRLKKLFFPLSALLAPFCTAGLIDNSPFIPPGFVAPGTNEPQKPASGAPIDSQLEFRGYYEINGELRFLIAKKGQAQGEWLSMESESESFRLLSFNDEEETIQVEHDSSVGWIPLKDPFEFTGTAVAAAASPARPTVLPAARNPSREAVLSRSSRTVRRPVLPTAGSSRISPNRPATVSGQPASANQRGQTVAPVQGPQIGARSLQSSIPAGRPSTTSPNRPPESEPPSGRPPRGYP
jgi:hypothetical protein